MASTHALAQATMKVFETRAPRRGIREAEREREREKQQKRARLKRNRYHYMLLGRKDRGPSPVRCPCWLSLFSGSKERDEVMTEGPAQSSTAPRPSGFWHQEIAQR